MKWLVATPGPEAASPFVTGEGPFGAMLFGEAVARPFRTRRFWSSRSAASHSAFVGTASSMPRFIAVVTPKSVRVEPGAATVLEVL